MAVAAGKFTLIPGDIQVPGIVGTNAGFHVNVGFEPDVVIVMTTGLLAEDTWDTTTDVWGGVMIMSRVPGYTTWQPAIGLSEWWYATPAPASFFSDTGVVWFRGTPGSAIYLANTYEDGFNVGYPGGFEGHYGAFCYYLAFQTDDNVAQAIGSSITAQPTTLGWEPNIFFTLGSGGTEPGYGAIAFASGNQGFSVPSFGFGGFDNVANPTDGGPQWLANGLSYNTSVEQQRYFMDGSGNQWVFDGGATAQTMDNSYYTFGRTPTTFSMNFFNGFPSGPNTRIAAHIMEGGLYSGGTVTPNPVGTPLEVDTGFSPEAVIFICPQDHHEPDIGTVPWGGRCFGFLTQDFQCCVAWGAYSHLGTVASFCTSNYSWISNFTSTQLNAITTPNYGTAQIGGPGFIMNTQALPKFNKYIRYAAYSIEEDAPGFFRVIN